MSKKFKLGVVGNPIEHSLSPFIHSRFARHENINLEYQAYKVEKDNFNNFVSDFFTNPNAKGLNITLPFKSMASKINGKISEEAKYINAVNTINKFQNSLSLETTDGSGFMRDLEINNIKVAGKNILIIGAGAAVESILYKLVLDNPNSITILNRSQDKADKLQNRYVEQKKISSALPTNKIFDLVINGSSAGLTGDFKAPGDIQISNKTSFYDLNYSLDTTPFCDWALNKSSLVYDGIGMLVNQASISFQLWFEVVPETKKVLEEIKSLKE